MMNNFDDDLDSIIEQVSIVEETIEFLSKEIKKYGDTDEIKIRIAKEYGELKKLSDALVIFCDKYGIGDDSNCNGSEDEK